MQTYPDSSILADLLWELKTISKPPGTTVTVGLHPTTAESISRIPINNFPRSMHPITRDGPGLAGLKIYGFDLVPAFKVDEGSFEIRIQATMKEFIAKS